jgi:predicted nucleotidyltransferase
MTILLPEQAAALRDLGSVCRELGVDVVVIGALAYRVWVRDDYRTTEDVDAAVTLDLHELSPLTGRLVARGWGQDPRLERRWHAPGGARVDLLPVGRKARQEKQIVWPRGGTRMSVLGYEHVFHEAVDRELEPGLKVRIVPPTVLGLLKIVAYLDAPQIREKDLQDLTVLMQRYEEDSDRRFGDEVLDAGVEYDEAGPYLLGRDLRTLCTAEDEVQAVERFLQRVCDPNFVVPIPVRRLPGLDEDHLARAFAALARGFRAPARPKP